MSTSITSELHDAHGVWTRRIDSTTHLYAIWHGGHTVNCYTVYTDGHGKWSKATGTRNTGDYATGETTRDEAKAAAMDMLTHEGEV